MEFKNYDLDGIIKPSKKAHFFDNFWDQQYLHIARDDDDYFKSLLDLEAFDRVLTSSDLRYPGIRMARNGQVLTSESFTRERGPYVDISKVIHEYHNGATIILESLDRSWEPLIQLVRKIEIDFQFSAQANAYLTPKNAQGFAPHSDSHDVFILQTAGSKCWQIYDQTDVVSKTQDDPSYENLGQPVLETVLHPGDTLYIPKGQVHQAKTSNEISLHITLGVHAYSWQKLMHEIFYEALKTVCHADSSYDRSVQMRTIDSKDILGEMHKRWNDVIQVTQNTSYLNDITDRIRNKVSSSRAPWLKGQLLELQHLDSINTKTTVHVRADVFSQIFRRENSVYLIFDGKEIQFPKTVESHLQYIFENQEMVVNDLPDSMDDDSKVVLIRRLVKEGLLTVHSID